MSDPWPTRKVVFGSSDKKSVYPLHVTFFPTCVWITCHTLKEESLYSEEPRRLHAGCSSQNKHTALPLCRRCCSYWEQMRWSVLPWHWWKQCNLSGWCCPLPLSILAVHSLVLFGMCYSSFVISELFNGKQIST